MRETSTGLVFREYNAIWTRVQRKRLKILRISASKAKKRKQTWDSDGQAPANPWNFGVRRAPASTCGRLIA
jgi:hypothetical protein